MVVYNKQFVIHSVGFSVMKPRTRVESHDRKEEQGMGSRVQATVMSASLSPHSLKKAGNGLTRNVILLVKNAVHNLQNLKHMC